MHYGVCGGGVPLVGSAGGAWLGAGCAGVAGLPFGTGDSISSLVFASVDNSVLSLALDPLYELATSDTSKITLAKIHVSFSTPSDVFWAPNIWVLDEKLAASPPPLGFCIKTMTMTNTAAIKPMINIIFNISDFFLFYSLKCAGKQ
jgi:hypothetical protein